MCPLSSSFYYIITYRVGEPWPNRGVVDEPLNVIEDDDGEGGAVRVLEGLEQRRTLEHTQERGRGVRDLMMS